uniref:restriction endonuclease subunit S n=1 Tax=Gelidibacter sp. TaxID=2018083 RepID=UPI004049E5EB
MKQDWEIKKLGEVCDIVNGTTPLRTNKEFWEGGNYPWFTIDDIREQGRVITDTKQKVTQAALKKLRILPVDTILLCCTASIGEYAITKIELTTNQQFNGLVIKNKKEISPMFLLYFSSTLKDTLSDLSGKATIDFIPISRLKDIEIPFPSLAEQQHIVAILDEAFAAIAKAKSNAEQNLKNAKELFESYLQGVFENKGEGWEEKTLGDVCEIDPKKSELKGLPVNHLVSFLPMKDLGISQNKIIPIVTRKLSEVMGSYTYFRDRDVLLAKVTPCFENGKLGIAENLTNGIGFGSSEYIVFRPLNNVISEYIFYLLSSNKFRNDGKKLMFGTTGLKRLSKDYVKNFLISLPSRKEQKNIVQKFDALSTETKNLAAIYNQKIKDLEELKKSVLQKAFSGELWCIINETEMQER